MRWQYKQMVLLILAGAVVSHGRSRLTFAEDEAPGSSTKSSATIREPASEQTRHKPNRLAKESSPYLLLHQHNPVDWYPWGAEAFQAAKKQNKPIFLSIGYSSCFWCHVMERKVFENEQIAAYMNEHFINIKVDREERPDLDDLYMTALQIYFQAIGSPQGGGWPLSMFLTPEGEPFAGGTYFPPADMPGRPGFLTVCRTVSELWGSKETEIRKTALLISNEVRRVMRPTPVDPTIALDRSLVEAAVARVLAAHDPNFGGLDFQPQRPNGPKFPVPSRLRLLQAQAGHAQEKKALAAVDKTLAAMAKGGIYDHLGGGFHRYSTDRKWLVPHFEKMLYDNAQLGEVYAEAYHRTNQQTYRDIAEGVYDFILREMTGPGGGFYSALDAETDGIEGAYYVWSPDEIRQQLPEDDARLFLKAYGLDLPEYFEHGYVLHLPRSLAETAAELKLPEAELRNRLKTSRARLLQVRRQRPALLKDDKVLTSWNGLMIASLAHGGERLGRPDYIQAAEKAALFIATQMRRPDGRLFRTWRNGKAKLNAYLDDYACYIAGLLALHEVTGDAKWLHAARRIMDTQVELFWDDAGGGFFFTSDDHEALLARTKNAYDSVLPSGNSVSVHNLVRMAVLTGDERYQNYARQTLRTFAARLKKSPGSMPFLALSLQNYLTAFPAKVDPSAPKRPTQEPMPSGSEPPRQDKMVPLAEKKADRAAREQVSARLYLERDKLIAGEPVRYALVLDIQAGWHINANPPRPDFVIPTEVSLTSKLETKLGQVHYPAGHDFQVQGFDEPLLVYERQVTLRGQLIAPQESAGQQETLQLRIRYQACNDKTCTRPRTITLSGSIPVVKTAEAASLINRPIFAPPKSPVQKK